MKTRRAFQVVLAVLSTLAALAFCATAIFVLVPLATGHKLPFLGEVVDGIYKIFATQYLSTTQVVIAESFILAPLVLAATAAILLFSKHGIQGVYKLAYIILMLAVAVPGITASVFSKQLFGAKQLMATSIAAAVVVLYLLLIILAWLVKVDPEEERAAKDARKAKKAAQKAAKKVTAHTATDGNATKTEGESAAAPEETTNGDIEDETTKRNRITVKRIEILQDLLKQRKISTMQYAALVEYVLSK